MADSAPQLPWRWELDLYDTPSLRDAAHAFADKLVARGKIKAAGVEAATAVLLRAGLYYQFGNDARRKLAEGKATALRLYRQGFRDAAGVVRLPKTGRPISFGERALISIMAQGACYFGVAVGTSHGCVKDKRGPFERLCDEWICCIEKSLGRHACPLPSRKVFRRALSRLPLRHAMQSLRVS